MRHKNARVPNPNEFKTSPGNKHHVLHEARLEPDGTLSLHEVGREDIQAMINSHAEETDMAVIINKLQYGDTSVLSRKEPMFGDFTQFPKTYAEAFDLVTRSGKAFENLPVGVKQKFDNDVSKWFSAIGSPEWIDLMGLATAPDVVPTPNESEVYE